MSPIRYFLGDSLVLGGSAVFVNLPASAKLLSVIAIVCPDSSKTFSDCCRFALSGIIVLLIFYSFLLSRSLTAEIISFICSRTHTNSETRAKKSVLPALYSECILDNTRSWRTLSIFIHVPLLIPIIWSSSFVKFMQHPLNFRKRLQQADLD